jgi:hypothetical protein
MPVRQKLRRRLHRGSARLSDQKRGYGREIQPRRGTFAGPGMKLKGSAVRGDYLAAGPYPASAGRPPFLAQAGTVLRAGFNSGRTSRAGWAPPTVIVTKPNPWGAVHQGMRTSVGRSPSELIDEFDQAVGKNRAGINGDTQRRILRDGAVAQRERGYEPTEIDPPEHACDWKNHLNINGPVTATEDWHWESLFVCPARFPDSAMPAMVFSL